MTAHVRRWFLARSLREQRLLLVMAALAVVTIVWAGIIRPVGDGLSSARHRHQDAVIRLAETEVRVAAIKALQRGQPATVAGPLDAVIRGRANDAGFALANVAAQGPDRVQIAIATARPGALFRWIAGLEASGILVDALSLTDNGDRTVGAQLVLKARGR